MPIVTALLCALLAATPKAAARAELTSLREVREIGTPPARRNPFSISGVVTHSSDETMVVEDGGILQFFHCFNCTPPPAGSLVNVSGFLMYANRRITMSARNIKITGRDTQRIPPPMKMSIADFLVNTPHLRIVTLVGTVDDAFRDEIDRRYLFFILKEGNDRVLFTFRDDGKCSNLAGRLVDAKVRITGLATCNSGFGHRHFADPSVGICDLKNIETLVPAPHEISDFPPLGNLLGLTPATVNAMPRRRLEGGVRAAWGGNSFLLRDADGRNIVVTTTLDSQLPTVGSGVIVAGHPETDYFNASLTRAMWKSIDTLAPPAEDEPQKTKLGALHTDHHKNRSLNPSFHAKLLRVRGTIASVTSNGEGSDRLLLRDGGFELEAISGEGTAGFGALEPGMEIDLTGICLLKTDRWHPGSPFPRASGFMLVTRSDGDVTVVSSAPWWTPARFAAAIGCLGAAIVILALWSVSLNRLANRRGRELLRATIDRERADLKADERTRLAIELHDSLSQNLSGVGCQIAATRRMMPPDASMAATRLETAERMLLSTRTELKRCLFDLRGDALECLDFEEAVRSTLTPVTNGIRLELRLRIARTLLNDSIAHTILCILRELASNAVCHGKATRIAIAGSIENGKVLVSCRDDGCGFDPGTCKGPGDGHFGLSGIRERARRVGGKATIESSAGSGCYTRIEIPLNGDETEEHS